VQQRIVKAKQLLQRARLIVFIGFGLVVTAILALVIALSLSRQADVQVLHTLQVEQAAETLLGSLRDAETGQRGFLLTGDKQYLEPFYLAIPAIPRELNDLSKLIANNSAQQAQFVRLAPLVNTKLDELKRTIDLVHEGDRDAALAIVNSDQGQKLMVGIRKGALEILRGERDVLAARYSRARKLRYVLAGLTATALLVAMILAAILAFSTRQALQSLIARTNELEEESKLRLEAEATLRQSQKMEALGQLTSCIAHDFNNLLTVIIGNLDTVKRQLAKQAETSAPALAGKLKKPVESALRSSRGAADLTQRLLVFSRRQALEPVRVDLNLLISGMLDMLRRTLGEQISIETVFGTGLWPVLADTHQLENVLLNLALNAKAAMPDGGCLTIETANAYLDDAYVRQFGDVDAGQYVALCVTDTGTGVPRDIIDRVFEPFFTTKLPGEGSGLGLAMVHGFVKQSGGHIRIYSEDGHGTTVKIYFPRLLIDEIATAPAPRDDVAFVPKAQGQETILLVEDNQDVRSYAKETLERLGYLVVDAGSSDDTVRLLTNRPHIDLLFTDIILPGSMNGRDLAARIREEYPDLPVLYTTGYTRNAIVHQGRLDPDVRLLNKPYSEQELARKVRELLDAA
jgi:signal transduction histidine kinase/CheY-like chemotaxis protein